MGHSQAHMQQPLHRPPTRRSTLLLRPLHRQSHVRSRLLMLFAVRLCAWRARQQVFMSYRFLFAVTGLLIGSLPSWVLYMLAYSIWFEADVVALCRGRPEGEGCGGRCCQG